MRRSRWERLLAALVAVWFAVGTAEPAVLHACPTHGHEGTAHRAAAHHWNGGLAGHAAHTAAGPAGDAAVPDAVNRGPSGSRPAHGAACTCPGDCCAATMPLLPAVTVIAVETTALRHEASTGRPEHEYVAAWADFVLPFPTAPPAPRG